MSVPACLASLCLLSSARMYSGSCSRPRRALLVDGQCVCSVIARLLIGSRLFFLREAGAGPSATSSESQEVAGRLRNPLFGSRKLEIRGDTLRALTCSRGLAAVKVQFKRFFLATSILE